jgi:hypothetical protein
MMVDDKPKSILNFVKPSIALKKSISDNSNFNNYNKKKGGKLMIK